MEKKTKRTALLLLGVLASTAIGIGFFCCANSALAEGSIYAGLVVTEIMYDPAGSNTDHAKWVELINLSSEKMTLNFTGSKTTSGWKMKDLKLTDSSNHYLYAQENTPIEVDPGDFLIVASNLTNFNNDYPGLKNILKSAITLSTADSNGFYNLTLYDNIYPLDTISYSKDWYQNTDGNGKSLEKIDLSGDNTKENWQESYKDGGSPGKEPELCEIETGISEENNEAPDSEEETATNTSKKTYLEGIIVNEILPDPEGKDEDGEFIELYNENDSGVDLENWTLSNKTGSSFSFPENWEIGPKDFLAIYYKDSKLNLHNSGGEKIVLKDPNGNFVSEISFTEKVKTGQSYAKSNNSFFWTSVPTPGKENVFDVPEDEDSGNSDISNTSSEAAGAATDEKVYLNEILPNPKGGSDDEYIEIAGGESGPVDLFGWRLKDGSKSKGYQFKEHIVLNSGEYFAIYRSDSKIALNNSDESVNLYNPQGEVVSSAAFDKSPKNASFNFDGKSWRWSRYLTPGRKNKFDSEPAVKIKKPKNVFKDLYTEFSAKAEDKETKKLKYVWDFGDGKKSYLAKTSHKYLATGKYAVTLSVTDDSQTVEKKFSLNVKKYPRPNLEIVKIIPNPAGEDAEKEIVEIKSNSSKKIDLAGWKIATGSGDKMNNHLIGGEISLEPNGAKTITREICKFSLNNKAGKTQLTMPDGKVIDEVEYQKEKIADDEAYVKIDDKWQWIAPNAPTNTEDPEETDDSEDIQNEESEEQPDGEVLGATDENASYHVPPQTGYTPEDKFIFYKIFGLVDYKPQEMNFCPVNEFSNTLAYL